MWTSARGGVCGLLAAAGRATGLCRCRVRHDRPTTVRTGPGPDLAVDEPTGDEAASTPPTQPEASASAPEGVGAPFTDGGPPLGGGVEGDLPPGPWSWRWVWPTPSRPGGMALVASDGTLVLWSPGGFATPGEAPDGRPTPDVASALARLPELDQAAAGADGLRSELDRARAVADETRRLLDRAVGAVDEEIDRVNGADGS